MRYFHPSGLRNGPRPLRLSLSFESSDGVQKGLKGSEQSYETALTNSLEPNSLAGETEFAMTEVPPAGAFRE